MINNSNDIIAQLFSILMKKITVPTAFHERTKAVKEMLQDDVSGLADSLTDYQVNSATVDFKIETSNPELTKKLNTWLENINADYKGQIPRGIRALEEEYYKERWKGSSFPILKIAKMDNVEDLIVPTKLFFVDGESVYAEEKPKEKNKQVKSFLSYEYYLGSNKEEQLDQGVIITKPYARWHESYPVPYLVKRGVLHNYLLIQSLKNKQGSTLEAVIPYLLLLKRGSEQLTLQGKGVTDEKLKETIGQLQDLLKKITDKLLTVTTPMRATQWDEEIEHLIPDLTKLFNHELFVVFEKAILSGLGFIDVVEAVSTSRRESVLNPKAFIEETKKGVKDFQNYILGELLYIVKKENIKHTKYFSDTITIKITHSPLVGLMTKDIMTEMRRLYGEGLISKELMIDITGETDIETEGIRRTRETENGADYTFYPPVTQNQEGKGLDIVEESPIKKVVDKNGKEIPEDKTNPTEKKDYDMGELVGSPYERIAELPDYIRKKFDIKKQRKWLTIWNNAYYYKYGKTHNKEKSESYAFRVANDKV